MRPRVLTRASSTAVLILALVLSMLSGCAPAMRSTAAGPLTAAQMSELWVNPGHLGSRDLLHGPGGEALHPGDGNTFAFRELDTEGYSRGYDVHDRSGREWSVKLGPEAQSEIAASRLLWAVGYHQPPMYYVSRWTIDGGPLAGPQPPGRFRPELPDAARTADWSWQQNPFVGTRPFKGLIVLNLLINNWDLKTTNNKIYQVDQLRDAGAADRRPGPPRWFVVRDLGAAFGKSRRFPYGTRNNIADFESQRFVTGVENGRVQFDYRGRHRELLADLTAADVTWACELMAGLSDRQLEDGFRAAGYGDETRARIVRKLKSKIAEGLALREEGER